MKQFICGEYSFDVPDSAPSQTYNRYRMGKIVEGNLYLDRFELSFLLLNAKSVFNSKPPRDRLETMNSLLEAGDFHLLIAFSHLKLKGYVLKVEKNRIRMRRKDEKSWSSSLSVQKEKDSISSLDLSRNSPELHAIVDDDCDISFYEIGRMDLRGSISREESIANGIQIDSALLIPSEGENRSRKKVGYQIFLEGDTAESNGRELDGLSDISVYLDLQKRGLAARTGFKYGVNFRVYASSIEEHAEYLLLVHANNEIRWFDIARAVRVASAVRKTFIIAFEEKSVVSYFSIKRLSSL